jgi:predicted transposase YbfD/YdcC
MEPVLSILRAVRDPRAFNARHELSAILFIALAATLCGQRTCVDIADFGAVNEAELAEIIDLPHGAPSHDCFSRLLRLLDPAELAKVLARFVSAIREGLGLGPPQGVVAVDGKSLRKACQRGRAYAPPLMVSVWDCETRVSIAAARAPGGSEVAATLALLRTLVLNGCIVTADALHCHPQMAEGVLASGADYALGLKGNHGPLHAAAVSAFEQADAKGVLPFYETAAEAHDRKEWRCASVLPAPADAPAFPGLAAIARIEAERVCGGKVEQSVRYVALSTVLSPQRLLQVVRAHWSIESQLHWQLDVSFDEDASRTRKDYAPENLSLIRRIALDILRAHPDKRSIRRKMNLARMSRPFFNKLFAHMR